MKANGILYAIRTTMMGLSTQMKRMELISENVANVEKSPDENGNIYHRKILIVKDFNKAKGLNFRDMLELGLRRTHQSHIVANAPGKSTSADDPFKVSEQDGVRLIFDPDHPMANEEGYVEMPNVNLVEEMVDMISASRAYEANVTIINAAKQMARRSLEI